MKRIFVLLAMMSCLSAAVAQSYEQMWKKADEAARNDFPQTAYNEVRHIAGRAQREHNVAQLLKARLMTGVYAGEISPDSALVHTRRLEAALRVEPDSTVRALYHAALVRIYAEQLRTRSVTDRPSVLRSLQDHFRASLRHPQQLMQVSANDWSPLFKTGPSSRYFADDLLHVLYYSGEACGFIPQPELQSWRVSLASLYEQSGRPEAALTLTLDSLESQIAHQQIDGRLDEVPSFASLCALARSHRELAANLRTYELLTRWQDSYDETSPFRNHNDSLLAALAHEGISLYGKRPTATAANSLRNFLSRLTAPSVQLGTLSEGYATGSRLRFRLSVRNEREVRLRIVKLYDESFRYEAERERKDWNEIKNRRVRQSNVSSSYTYRFAPVSPWKWQEHEAEISLPVSPGVYLARLSDGSGQQDDAVFRISSLQALIFHAAGPQTRVTVVNGTTGKPVAGAVVTAYDRRQTHARQKYTTDHQGKVWINREALGGAPRFYVSTATDAASVPFSLYRHSAPSSPSGTRSGQVTDLFTDRAIYRPGQTVSFSGVVYRYEGDDYRVQPRCETTVKLYNVHRKVVDSLTVRTDSLGTFSGTFRLPAACLPGYFQLQTTQGRFSGHHYFRVEEYKRPAFLTETQPLTDGYAPGDTIHIKGRAETYSGIPVGGARVKYSVTLPAALQRTQEVEALQTGETITATDGRFALPIYLTPPTRQQANLPFIRLYYQVNYTVTADNGETIEGQTLVRTATQPAYYEKDVPAVLCREHLSALSFRLVNAAGETIDTLLRFTLIDEAQQTVYQGQSQSGDRLTLDGTLRRLPSGVYRFVLPAFCGATADTARVVLFSETDVRPADRSEVFFTWQRTNATRDSVWLQVGSPLRDAVLYYDLTAAGRLLESRQIFLSDSLLTFRLGYRPEMGDGARLTVCMVRDGKVYTAEAEVEKPRPDKRLVLRWHTFRPFLQPGQQEEWRLTVTYPDGTPAPVSVLARLYDASLDALATDRCDFTGIFFPRYLTPASVRFTGWQEWNGFRLSLFHPSKSYPVEPFGMTHWHQSLFSYPYHSYDFVEEETAYATGSAGIMKMRTKTEVADRATNASQQMKQLAAAPKPQAALRTNFAETAFFLPQLRTDSRGEVSLTFTLPESMTRWNFTALAHDGRMNFARLDTFVVARKTVMAEAALPRFVRTGDHTWLPVRLTNLSDRAVTLRLRVSLTSWEAKGETLWAEEREVRVTAGSTEVVHFPYTVQTAGGALLFRVTAEGDGFADGEERLLPVLGDRVTVTRTLPFTLRDSGSQTLRLDSLFRGAAPEDRSLTVEFTSNPAWYAVTALPVLAGNAQSLSATEWSTRFYALALGARLLQLNPGIRAWADSLPGEVEALSRRQTEGLTEMTPWLNEGETQQRRAASLNAFFHPETLAALQFTALDKLRALQQSNGGWSWYPGMPVSQYITVDIAVALARVQRLAENYEAKDMLQKAAAYLKKEMARQVAEMKQSEKSLQGDHLPTLSEVQLRYLYLLTLLGERPDADARYLLDRAENTEARLSMYGKALAAVVLADFGRDETARRTLRSLLEHTVSTGDTGRWFDTRRAWSDPQSYRIPTQCAAIEAVSHFGMDDEADALRQWLLQARRTQLWETSQASADAVYALLSTAGRSYSATDLRGETLRYELLRGRKTIDASDGSESTTAASAGYYQKVYTDGESLRASRLILHKRSSGMSWGCVYATFTQPVSSVRNEGSDLHLVRHFEVQRGDRWESVDNAAAQVSLSRGERVRQVFELTADRDFDFVQLSASRPACLEPVRPLSGYVTLGGLSAYRVVHDAATDFFIARLPKGHHRFTEELFVVRPGVYASGIARLTSVFAPEFSATAASQVLESK